MEYLGPDARDLLDVYALNREFLSALRDREVRSRLLTRVPAPLSDRLASLSDEQRRRLANAPFLLMSLSEEDDACWEAVFRGEPVRPLFATFDRAACEISRLTATLLGFLWRLARQNPYAARLLSSAPLGWCERLAAASLIDVVACAAPCGELPGLRRGRDRALWDKLLVGGIRPEPDIRTAARLSALHCLLTDPEVTRHRRQRAAACPMPTITRHRAGSSRPPAKCD